jgi:hypothetical protein
MSIVSDGADDVMASAISYDRYPDCPRSQPPLAAEDNLNPERAQEALCPAQSARECAGTLWPAKPVGADLQKVGCASRPLRSVGHDLAHKGRHWIDVDDVLDRGAPLDGISDFEGARGSKCALAWLTSRSGTQHRTRHKSHLGLRNPAREFLHLRAGVHSSDFPRKRFHFFRKMGSETIGRLRQCRRALFAERDLPAGVLGPVLKRAFARFELILHLLVTRQCSAWVMCFRLSGADDRRLAAPPDACPVSAFHDGDQFRAKCLLPPSQSCAAAAVQTTPADAAGVLPTLFGASRPHLLCVSVNPLTMFSFCSTDRTNNVNPLLWARLLAYSFGWPERGITLLRIPNAGLNGMRIAGNP